MRYGIAVGIAVLAVGASVTAGGTARRFLRGIRGTDRNRQERRGGHVPRRITGQLVDISPGSLTVFTDGHRLELGEVRSVRRSTASTRRGCSTCMSANRGTWRSRRWCRRSASAPAWRSRGDRLRWAGSQVHQHQDHGGRHRGRRLGRARRGPRPACAAGLERSDPQMPGALGGYARPPRGRHGDLSCRRRPGSGCPSTSDAPRQPPGRSPRSILETRQHHIDAVAALDRSDGRPSTRRS